jgi:hypothetical protein
LVCTSRNDAVDLCLELWPNEKDYGEHNDVTDEPRPQPSPNEALRHAAIKGQKRQRNYASRYHAHYKGERNPALSVHGHIATLFLMPNVLRRSEENGPSSN